jgi:hypothetical protein
MLLSLPRAFIKKSTIIELGSSSLVSRLCCSYCCGFISSLLLSTDSIMAPHSPAKKRRKVVKASSPFFSPGTKKAQKKTKALIINQAAMDLIGRMGDDGRAPVWKHE